MMKSNQYGLYVHIPFCIRKCNYCDFLSFSANKESRMAYIRSLEKEMVLWNEKVSAGVDTIFIGGGTPSMLEPEEMDVLFQAIHDNFFGEQTFEFTIECNPGTVTGEKFRLMKSAGINRVSFGMQSTNNRELQILGRIHTYEEFLSSYQLARKSGFDNINIDLMSAIPEQTIKSYEDSLRRVVMLNPEHISSYSLIIEEGTPFYERYGDNPPVDEETDRIMYEQTGEILAAAGYERYEISNYSKQGKECRHNLKYWQREDYIGTGLSAASCFDHKRLRNEASIESYRQRIQENELPVCETEELTREDEMAEFMYLGLRCMKGISVKQFEENFGQNFSLLYGKKAELLESQGLLEWKNDRIRLTRRGIDVSNRIFAEFI